jgi:K+-sensing histidine kinase KdpD
MHREVVPTFAERHGGRIWTEPRPGGGTRMKVALPQPATANGSQPGGARRDQVSARTTA